MPRWGTNQIQQRTDNLGPLLARSVQHGHIERVIENLQTHKAVSMRHNFHIPNDSLKTVMTLTTSVQSSSQAVFSRIPDDILIRSTSSGVNVHSHAHKTPTEVLMENVAYERPDVACVAILGYN